MATTAEQIRASATAALGAASSQQIAAPNTVQAAPSAVNQIPAAATTDVVQPAPAVSLEMQIVQLQAQLAQALGVIATIQPKAVAAVQGERTYHSVAPFVKIHVMRAPGICEEFQFKGNRLTTDDPGAIAFLEAAIASGASGFSHAPIDTSKLSAEEIEMRKDVMGLAVVARDKMVAAGEKVA